MRGVTAVLICCLCASAQTTKQERGKALIDETVSALGGDAFLKFRNRVDAGRAYSFFREELSGLSIATIYTQYVENPAPGEVGVRERQSFGKEERYGAVLFADGKGYEITFRGARPYPDERLERWRESTLTNVFYILKQRLREPGLILEAGETDIMDNQPVQAVDITDAENRVVTVWLHRSTKLPVRQRYFRRDPKTRQRNEEVTIWSKYRDVGGGVQWPLDVQRLRDGDKIFQMYSDSVQVNQPLDDKLFRLAPGMKVLKPVK